MNKRTYFEDIPLPFPTRVAPTPPDIGDEDEEKNIAFPVEALPPVARAMTAEIARVSTSGNVPLAALCVIGIGSAALGGGIALSSGGGRQTKGNLYILGIAESGAGKGESFNLAAAPFYAAGGEALRRFEEDTRRPLDAELQLLEREAKSLAQKAANKEGEEAGKLRQEFQILQTRINDIKARLAAAPKYSVADATKEALGIAMLHQPHNAIASLSSEARGIFSIVKGRYGKEGGDEDFYCSAYSGDTLIVDRVNRDRVHLQHPCLTLLWLVQPGAAQEALGDEKLRDSGFLARCLIVDVKAEPRLRDAPPVPISTAINQAWTKTITGLLTAYRNNQGDAFCVQPDDGAVQVLHSYEQENIRRRTREGDLSDMAPSVARWGENAYRLALVFHALEHGSEAHARMLSSSTAESAVIAMRWFSERQLEALAVTRTAHNHKRLLSLLAVLAQHGGKITLRNLGRSHGFDEDEIRRLHQLYPSRFTITEEKPPTGRPSVVVTLT
ncbi:MAG: DUF3987 domain-containing protein [Akkermansiaceae bacterium]|nr:DUF3987 domain-containing protein [Akkermansiaceae bacterium]